MVDFGDDATDNYYSSLSNDSESPPQAFLPGRSTARLPRMSKLQRFLQNLALKPAGAAADPTVDETLEELLVEPAAGGEMFGGVAGGSGVDSMNAANEDEKIADGLDGFGGGGTDKDKDGTSSAERQQQQQQRRSRPNPEVDSFAYIEMLLEALAALGKLGYALDAVGQRIQGELFALVEATIEEVEERQVCAALFSLSLSLSLSLPVLPLGWSTLNLCLISFLRARASVNRNESNRTFANSLIGGGGSGMRPVSNLYVPPSPDPNQPISTAHAVIGTSIASSLSAISGAFATDGVAALLRLTPSETSGLANSVETLRDLFWTLYSKLDAVLQGFRVAYEVAGRIAEVRQPAKQDLDDEVIAFLVITALTSSPCVMLSYSDETSRRRLCSSRALATFCSRCSISGDLCSKRCVFLTLSTARSRTRILTHAMSPVGPRTVARLPHRRAGRCGHVSQSDRQR